MPLGESLKPGTRDPRVPTIRTRLRLTDGVRPSSAEPEIYDDALADAVKQFQARQGLESDGVIGASTIVAMNVPIQERIQSIVMAMERLRWMPEDLGQQYVIVNIAGIRSAPHQRWQCRGANGRRRRQALPPHPGVQRSHPVCRVDPYWTVPPAILANEELPKLRKNPASLRRRD